MIRNTNLNRQAFVANNVNFTGSTAQRAAQKIGSYIPDKAASFTELTNTASMGRNAFASIAFIFLFGSRVMNARNEDERREVIIRDLPSMGTAVFGVPLLKKVYCHFNNKTSGVPVSQNGSIVSTSQLGHWYSNINKMENGLTSFCENISSLGGNAKKCILGLGEETKKAMEDICGKVIPDSNEELIKVIKDAKQNPQLKGAVELIENSFSKDNALLKKATKLKSIPEAACIALTAAALGWLIPWFNIINTKHIYEQKNQQNNNQPQPSVANAQNDANSQILAKFAK